MIDFLLRLLCCRDALRIIDAFLTSFIVESEKWRHDVNLRQYSRRDSITRIEAYDWIMCKVYTDNGWMNFRSVEGMYLRRRLVRMGADTVTSELLNF